MTDKYRVTVERVPDGCMILISIITLSLAAGTLAFAV